MIGTIFGFMCYGDNNFSIPSMIAKYIREKKYEEAKDYSGWVCYGLINKN